LQVHISFDGYVAGSMVKSDAQADKYYFMLLDLSQELTDGKVAGKHYPDVRMNVFGFRSGQHIIFYRNLTKKE